MAYIDFTLAPSAPRPAAAASAFLLDETEQAVIRLSSRDAPSSVARGGRLSQLAERLFGLARPNPLADPRLEALRRFAILYRRRGEAACAAEEPLLEAAGYTRRQIAHARRLLEPEHARRRKTRLRLELGLLTMGGVLLAISTHRGLSAALDSPLMALILLGLGAVTVSPLVAAR
jgi:hypothetical protein